MNREATLVDFKLSDLEFMDPDVETEYGDFKQRVKDVMKRGETKTAYYEGKVLGAMGYFELWPGVCEVWITSAKDLDKGGVFALIIRDGLNRFIDPGKFHRVQATAKDTKINETFFIRMGFVCEGLLKKYSITKQDYKMWARVK